MMPAVTQKRRGDCRKLREQSTCDEGGRPVSISLRDSHRTGVVTPPRGLDDRLGCFQETVPLYIAVKHGQTLEGGARRCVMAFRSET